MSQQRTIAIGMAMGTVCAAILVLLPGFAPFPTLQPGEALPLALLFPAATLIAMIGRIAQRRFFDPDLIEGQHAEAGSPADIDQRVLTNTVEQALIAVLVWPFVAMVQGGAATILLGAGFMAFRALFWIGYHRAPPFRAMGFAGTFYSTVLALLWSLVTWIF